MTLELKVDGARAPSRWRYRACWLLPLLIACNKPEREAKPATREAEPAANEAAPHADEPEHEPLDKMVSLSAEVIRAAQIHTSEVRSEVLPTTLALPGELAVNPDRAARLSSPIPGIASTVHFQEGTRVKKGDLLATIRVPDLGKLRSAHMSALARAKAARANVARLEPLRSAQLTSEQSYLDAVAAAESLELEARAAAEQLGALGLGASTGNPSTLALRAPLSGVVVMRSVVVGQLITASEPLCEIVDLSEVWFLGRVFEKDLGELKPGAAAEVQLNAYPRRRFQGRIEYIGQQVDPVARTVTARIRLDNEEGLLRVGLFGTAYVSTNEPGQTAARLVVPRSALTEITGKPAVFVQHADGDFELHEVVLGGSAEGKVEVLSGLREGERVVDEGVFTLKSAVLKRTFAEEE